MPGTAKVIAIFVLALKENAAEVRTFTTIKYCYGLFHFKIFIFKMKRVGSSNDSAIFKVDFTQLDIYFPFNLSATEETLS